MSVRRAAPPSWCSCSPRRCPRRPAPPRRRPARARPARDDPGRALVAAALDAVKAGDRDKAYAPRPQRLPRPLRVRRDPAAPARPEPRARHRVQVRRRCATRSATARRSATMRDDAADGARAACSTSDRALAAKGVAAPAIAFGFSFSILFREGVEAVLLIAILLGSLAAGSAQRLQAAARARASLGALGATRASRGCWRRS